MTSHVGPAMRCFNAIALAGLMLLVPFSTILAEDNAPKNGGSAPMDGPAPKALGDWPAFKNDVGRTGYSNTEAPDSRTILWQNVTDNVQQGFYGSPVVANNRVFIGSTNSKFYAFDATTGKQLWNNTTSNGDYGICASPVVSNGYVIIYVNNDDSLYSFNVSTGALRWKAATGAGTAGGSSPVVHSSKVYVGAPNGRLYARNENDGSASWNFQMEGANQPNGLGIISSPAIYNNSAFFGGGDKKFYAVNLTTHNKVWAYTLSEVGNPSPAAADGVVYYAEGAHTITNCASCGVYAFDVDGFADGNDGWTGESATGATDGDIIWKKSMSNTTTSSPAVYGNYVFVGSMDNKFYAINRSNGNTLWSYDTGRDIIGSPSVADGKVFVADQNSKLYAFDIDGFADGNDGWTGEALTGSTNGDIIWNYSMGGLSWVTPAISNGVLYTGNSQGKIFAIGTPSADVTPPQIVSTDPLNGAKNISLDKTVHARFSEAVIQATVTGANFTLKDSQANPVAGSVAYNPVNFEMAFDPATNLKAHEKYTASIVNIKDLFDNAIASPYTWTFTTINTPPTLAQGSVSPANGDQSTIFQFKVVYADLDNDTPSGGVKVHLDNNATGKAMVVDHNATLAAMHDGNLANGEAFIYNTTFSTAGLHNYQFKVTDGFDLNVTQKFNGPQVTAANQPPVIGAIPDQAVTEDIPYTFDLGPYLSDPDNGMGQLTMSVTSQYLTGKSGFNATFLFPQTAPASSDIEFNVTDGINTVQKTVRFVLTYVDDAPVLSAMPDLNVNASEAVKFDVAPYITDVDTPLSGMTVSTNSSYIMVSGLNLTLNYSRTVTKELVNVSVKDAKTTVYGEFWVSVYAPPLNQPPVLDPVPDATPTEDVPLDYDLLGKIHDDGLPKNSLRMQLVNPSPYVKVSGPFLRLLYPNGVLSDTINFNVTDGEFNISGQLKVKVTPVNDAPALKDGPVQPVFGPKDKNVPLSYAFNVTVGDIDSPDPSVWVYIDNTSYQMSRGAKTTILSQGQTIAAYYYTYEVQNTALAKGTHNYKFKVDDKAGALNSNVESAPSAFEVVKPKKVQTNQLASMLPFLLIIIVVVVVIVVAAVLMMRRKKPTQAVPPQVQPQQVDLMSGQTGMPEAPAPVPPAQPLPQDYNQVQPQYQQPPPPTG